MIEAVIVLAFVFGLTLGVFIEHEAARRPGHYR